MLYSQQVQTNDNVEKGDINRQTDRWRVREREKHNITLNATHQAQANREVTHYPNTADSKLR